MRNNLEFKELVNDKYKILIKKKKEKRRNALIFGSSLFVCVLLCTVFLQNDAIKKVFSPESEMDTVLDSEEHESNIFDFQSGEYDSNNEYLSFGDSADEDKLTSDIFVNEEDISKNQTNSNNDLDFESEVAQEDAVDETSSPYNEDNDENTNIEFDEAGTESIITPESDKNNNSNIVYINLPYRISWSNSQIINRIFFEEVR